MNWDCMCLRKELKKLLLQPQKHSCDCADCYRAEGFPLTNDPWLCGERFNQTTAKFNLVFCHAERITASEEAEWLCKKRAALQRWEAE